MKCLLVGNYGVGNLGDEALKEYFLKRLIDVEWTALSAAPSGPREVPRLPFGFRSFFAPWWKTLSAFRSCDAVVFGGGSLFTDAESVLACLLWGWHALVALWLGKKIVLAFQGIGPFRTGAGEWCARWVIKRAAFISVRDNESEARARAWARVRIIQTFDPVLLLLESRLLTASEGILGVIPRLNSGENFFKALDQQIITDQPREVRILSMQPDSAEEKRVCIAIKNRVGGRARLSDARTIPSLLDELQACDRVITERYHGAMFAMALGIPVEIISQRPGDKLDVLRSMIGDLPRLRALASEGERELQKFINVLK